MSITSVIRYCRALDSTATDGSGKTALAFGDITAKYLIQGGTLTALTTETITTLGTYQAPTSAAHIRIKELSSSDPCKGVYEVHFHNTQMVDTGKKLWLFLSASGAAFTPLEVELIAQTGDVYALQTTAMADSIPADGTRPSPTQAIYMMVQGLFEGAISGTTWTIRKVDGSTSLFTVTLDSATVPTSKTRAT